MVATTSVTVSPSTLLALMERLRDSGATMDPGEAVDAAIRQWLAATDNAPPAQPAAPRGYQWKTLFLPEGTWLRMAYRNDHEYAIVEGDHIMYQGRAVSPNQFASGYADSVRNAWHDISIRMPGEKHWKIASVRRRELARAAATPIVTPSATPIATPSATQIATPDAAAASTASAIPAISTLLTNPAILAILANLVNPAPLPTPPTPATATAVTASLTTEAAAAATSIALPGHARPAAPRDTTPGQGWTEPERRKYRFRLEDVAFD